MEKTVIDGLIDHSKAIHKYKMFLASIRNFVFAFGRIPDTLPTEKKLKTDINDIELESLNRIEERNEACKKYLIPLLGGSKEAKELGFEDRFHFSESELKDGYVLLHRNKALRAEKVLFLSDYLPGKVKKGNINEFENCHNLLSEVPSALKPGELLLKSLVFPKNQN